MATKRRISLPTVGTPAAGKTFTVVGKMNLRYHQIIIEYCDNFSGASRIVGTDGAGGVASTLINDMRVMCNQKAQRTHTAFELDSLNKSNGTQYAYQTSGSGATLKQRLCIFFAEPWRKNPADQDACAFSSLEVNGVDKDSFKIEIDLAALAGNSGAVAPSISAYAIVDDPINVQGGQLLNKVYRQQITVAASGVDVAVAAKDWLQAIFLRHPSTAGLITKATLKRNGVTMNELPADTNGGWLTNMDCLPLESPAVTGYATAGGFGYTLMLDSDDPINSALAMRDPNGIAYDFDFHIDFNISASGNMFALYQKLGKLD